MWAGIGSLPSASPVSMSKPCTRAASTVISTVSPTATSARASVTSVKEARSSSASRTSSSGSASIASVSARGAQARRVDAHDDVGLGPESLDHLDAARDPRTSELEVVGADAEDDPAAQRGAGGQRQTAGAEARLAVLDDRLDQVHRRRADEGRDEQVGGMLEQHLGRVALLQHASAQDRDALAERHRLDLVVGDVDGRHAQPLVQARELGPHRDAQLGVEVAQRLVHQERLRLAHDRAAHRDALALAAGQLARLALEHLLQAEDLRDLVDAGAMSRLDVLRSFRPKPRLARTERCGYSA